MIFTPTQSYKARETPRTVEFEKNEKGVLVIFENGQKKQLTEEDFNLFFTPLTEGGEFFFKEPKGIEECEPLAWILSQAHTLYHSIGVQGRDAFYTCLFLLDWSAEDLKALSKHIFDKKDGLPLSDPVKNISMQDFFYAIDCFSNWACDIEIPYIRKDRLGLINGAALEKAVDRVIAWKKDEEVDMGRFLGEAFKKALGG